MLPPNSMGLLPPSIQNMDFLRSFLDTLPLGALIADLNGKIVYCNETQAKIDDMPVDYIVGKTELELYGPYVGPGIIRSCQMTGKPILGFVCYYRTAHGKIVNGAYWVYPLYEDGKVSAALCLTQLLGTKNPVLVPGKELNDDEIMELGSIHYTNETGGTVQDEQPVLQIVGGNPAFRRVLSMAETTASSPSPVMISGETGTGKEMIVKAIRKASNRYDKPYMAINCSAIPSTLLEGMLFGAVKGSFTGAIDRPGLFEEADGGILYLDEIDSMNMELQPKLLRVLQDMRVRRLGSSVERALNVKVISSIGGSPEQVLAEGKLRPDLFYRLAVITLCIPPLRERMDDLNDLIAHFVGKYNRLLKKQVKRLDVQVERLFNLYDWPGNIRELEHVIAGAINLTAWENVLHLHHIPDHHRYHLERLKYTRCRVKNSDFEPGTGMQSLDQKEHTLSLASLADQEVENLRIALTKTQGHVTNAARLLGISRQLLNYKLKKYGIQRKLYVLRED